MPPLPAPFELIPRIVVKLEDGLGPGLGADETDIAGLAQALGPAAAFLPAFQQLLDLLETTPIRSVFGSIQDLDGAVQEASANDQTYEPPDFSAFLELDVPGGVDPEGLAATFESWVGFVEEAFVSSPRDDPSPVVGTTNPLFVQQSHLEAAPTGIGAQAAWAVGADGSAVRFMDIEQGWFLDHEDLRPNTIPLLGGFNRRDSRGHGTAVLGTVVARDNNLGGVGVAPGARTNTSLVSWLTPAGPPGAFSDDTARRVGAAAVLLDPGDVLLIEIQNQGVVGGVRRAVPVETDRDVFAAIRLATAKGIVVVEPAGNGSADLDTFVNRAGKHVLRRNPAGELEDSGAILVGACTKAFPRRPNPTSNRGSRVDCHALGDHLVTTGSLKNGEQENPFLYFLTPVPDVGEVPFGHTSGASAIIAGVCLLVQHLRALLPSADLTSGPLDCSGMRRVLQADANGSPSFAISDKIGNMPDLARIIDNEFIQFT
jgi:subtilase family protein